MNMNSRALKAMDKIQAATGLSEEGKLGLIQLFNPLMDFEQRRVGFAGNADESASVVQVIKKSVVLSAPPGTTTTWSANIFNTPICVPQVHAAGYRMGNKDLLRGPTTGNNIGPFVALTAPAGHDLSVNNAALDPSVFVVPSTFCPDSIPIVTAAGEASSYFSGTSQIIGMGFEVHDTTAEIFKQGSITCYRVPQTPIFDTNFAHSCAIAGPINALTEIDSNGFGTEHDVADVPGNTGAAMLLHGSRQWEAREGAMVVPSLIDNTIPVTDLDSVFTVIKTGTYVDAVPPASGGGSIPAEQITQSLLAPAYNLVVGTVAGTGAKVLDAITEPPLQKYNNFNSSGLLIEGLAQQATILLTTIMYIERYPTVNDVALVVLASPSPKLDPMMMVLYSQIMRELPVAVKVCDNADGDWFF